MWQQAVNGGIDGERKNRIKVNQKSRHSLHSKETHCQEIKTYAYLHYKITINSFDLKLNRSKEFNIFVTF